MLTGEIMTEEKKTVPASVAMLKVLEAWGVKNVYGLPRWFLQLHHERSGPGEGQY